MKVLCSEGDWRPRASHGEIMSLVFKVSPPRGNSEESAGEVWLPWSQCRRQEGTTRFPWHDVNEHLRIFLREKMPKLQFWIQTGVLLSDKRIFKEVWNMKSLILQMKRLLEVKIVRLTLHVVFFNSFDSEWSWICGVAYFPTGNHETILLRCHR